MPARSEGPARGGPVTDLTAAAATIGAMATVSGGRLLEVDVRAFGDAFGARPLEVRHALADHPLLTLEAIAEFAETLPSSAVERHAGEQPTVVPGGAPDLDGAASATVREIEHNGAWLV